MITNVLSSGGGDVLQPVPRKPKPTNSFYPFHTINAAPFAVIVKRGVKCDIFNDKCRCYNDLSLKKYSQPTCKTALSELG